MQLIVFKELIGAVAVITTIVQFLSGVLVCKQYVDKQTTGDASPLPFLCGVISCLLWLLYGCSKNDGNIVFVNVVGVTLMTLYSGIFFFYSHKKHSVLKKILATLVIILVIRIYVYADENDNELILQRLGALAIIFTLLTIAAPMTKLLHVIRVKNTECLPFPMILMSFFVSMLWYLYSEVIQDYYIAFVNLVGGGLAVLQLILFVIYPRKPNVPVFSKTANFA